MWSGEINGSGFPVPGDQRAHAGWNAIRGHVLDVVER
jgi:hypothetical protein